MEVPQDRQSSFESQIIPKRKKDIFAIDDKIISMYAKGMTTRQIFETIEDIYGFEVMDSISAWICLIPFLLIIPFTACISYYRLASAHINSFLRKFGQKDMQFELGANVVNEGKCTCYSLIAWLINHEMVLLSVAISGIFYFKYII